MNQNEMQELNEWIHIRVFGWKHSCEKEYPNRRGYSRNTRRSEFCLVHDMPDYCTDPAASRQLEKKCIERLKEKYGSSIFFVLTTDFHGWNAGVGTHTLNLGRGPCIEDGKAETLELAISLFARKLWEK